MNLAGLSAVLDAFVTGMYTVTRRAAMTVGSDGRATATDPPTVLSVQAAVVPLSGQDLQRLPEGSRIAERRKLYLRTLLKAGAAPDIVSVGGRDYEVESVMDWTGYGSDFFEIIVVRVGD